MNSPDVRNICSFSQRTDLQPAWKGTGFWWSMGIYGHLQSLRIGEETVSINFAPILLSESLPLAGLQEKWGLQWGAFWYFKTSLCKPSSAALMLTGLQPASTGGHADASRGDSKDQSMLELKMWVERSQGTTSRDDKKYIHTDSIKTWLSANKMYTRYI